MNIVRDLRDDRTVTLRTLASVTSTAGVRSKSNHKNHQTLPHQPVTLKHIRVTQVKGWPRDCARQKGTEESGPLVATCDSQGPSPQKAAHGQVAKPGGAGNLSRVGSCVFVIAAQDEGWEGVSPWFRDKSLSFT